MVLVPTKELARQGVKVIKQLAQYCSREIVTVDVSEEQSSLLVTPPDVVVGTPSRVLGHVNAGHLDLSRSVKMLVIDEADLVFSYGYEE